MAKQLKETLNPSTTSATDITPRRTFPPAPQLRVKHPGFDACADCPATWVGNNLGGSLIEYVLGEKMFLDDPATIFPLTRGGLPLVASSMNDTVAREAMQLRGAHIQDFYDETGRLPYEFPYVREGLQGEIGIKCLPVSRLRRDQVQPWVDGDAEVVYNHIMQRGETIEIDFSFPIPLPIVKCPALESGEVTRDDLFNLARRSPEDDVYSQIRFGHQED